MFLYRHAWVIEASTTTIACTHHSCTGDMLSHWLDFDQSSRRIVLAHICSPVGKYDWSSLLMTHSLHLWAYFSQSPDTYCVNKRLLNQVTKMCCFLSMIRLGIPVMLINFTEQSVISLRSCVYSFVNHNYNTIKLLPHLSRPLCTLHSRGLVWFFLCECKQDDNLLGSCTRKEAAH